MYHSNRLKTKKQFYMKKITHLFLLAAGVLGTASCSDFLDQTSPSELTQETISQSSYYTGLTVNKVYGDLANDYTYSQYIPIVWGTELRLRTGGRTGRRRTEHHQRTR